MAGLLSSFIGHSYDTKPSGCLMLLLERLECTPSGWIPYSSVNTDGAHFLLIESEAANLRMGGLMVEPLYWSLLRLTIIMYNRYCNGKYISEWSKMLKYLATKWSISSFRKYILVGLKSDYCTRLGAPVHTHATERTEDHCFVCVKSIRRLHVSHWHLILFVLCVCTAARTLWR